MKDDDVQWGSGLSREILVSELNAAVVEPV